MKKPNFFIVGAPKCGTTALAYYLSNHPDIFISEPKEPNYFLHPCSNNRWISEKKHYLSIFEKAKGFPAIGEASVFYLYSNYARKQIKEFIPHAKIIIMIRNPVDFVASLHSQKLYGGYEQEKDLATAWHRERGRSLDGREITIEKEPDWTKMYAELMRFEKYIHRYCKEFGKEKVMVIKQENMLADTRQVYLSVLNFLDVSDDGRMDFERVNSNKVPHSYIYRDFLCTIRNQRWAFNIVNKLKAKMGIGTFGLYSALAKLNRSEKKRSPVPERIKHDILSRYKELGGSRYIE